MSFPESTVAPQTGAQNTYYDVNGEAASVAMSDPIVMEDPDGFETEPGPSVAELRGGNFVTVWSATGKSDGGIYAQLHDSKGEPVDGVFQLAANDAATYTYLASPVVTALDDGGYAVAYLSQGQDGIVIGYRTVDQYGMPGEEHIVAEDVSTMAAVTTLAGGDVLVAWTDNDGLGRYQVYDADGVAAGVRQDVPSKEVAIGLSVAGLTGGGYAAAWSAPESNTLNVAVYGAPASTGAQQAPLQVLTVYQGAVRDDGLSSDGAGTVRVAALDNGHFVAVWNEVADGSSSTIGFQVLDETGAKIGEPQVANTHSGSFVSTPAVSALHDGGFVVAWECMGIEAEGDRDVVARRFDDNGDARDVAEFQVDTFHAGTDEQYASLAPLADGGFAVVWGDGSDAGTTIQAAVARPADAGNSGAIGNTDPDAGGPPTATVHLPSGMTPTGGNNTLSFTVTYTDHSGKGLDPASVGADNISVATNWGDSMQVVGAVLQGDTVTYTVEAPGASWDRDDSGHYYVTLLADGVRDLAGNTTPEGPAGDFYFDIPVPYDLYDDVISVSAGEAVVATLTPAGYDGAGTWFLEGQSVPGLFSLEPASAGNQGVLSIADKLLLPPPGTTVSVTTLYYGQYQLDADGKPVEGEGVERTLYYTVTDGGELVALTPSAHVGNDAHADVASGALATLADGTYVTVWAQRDWDAVTEQSDMTIYAEVRDAAGQVVREQLALTLPGDGKYETDPAIAARKDGGFILAYTTETDDGYAVVYRAVGADGAAGDELVAAAGVRYDATPAVAAAADGSAMLAWIGDGEIVIQQLGSDGAALGGRSSIPAGGDPAGLNIIALRDGGYVLSWGDERTQDLHFAMQPAQAQVQAEVHDIAIGGDGDYNAGAHMAALADGGFVLVFDRVFSEGEESNIHFQRYDAKGNQVADGLADVSAGTYNGNPDVAALSGGGFVITWQSDNGDGDEQVVGRRFGADGKPVDSAEFLISDDHSFEHDSHARVTGLADGGFATAWAHEVPRDERADLRTSVHVGAAPQPADPVPSDPPPTDPTPSDPPPADPTPADPTPTDPTPSDPTPSDPTPTDPTPTDPTPADPTPSDPTPADPTPTDPTPTDPTPADPTPSNPTPSNPTPPAQPEQPVQQDPPADNTVHGTVDGVAVDTTQTGNATIVNVPVITVTRAEDPATAHRTLADIPLAVSGADGGSKTLLTASLPTGAGLHAEGPAALQTNAQALLDLIARIESKTTAGSSVQAEMKGEGHGFLEALGQNVLLQTATLTPVVGGAVNAPIIITGNSVSGANTGTAIGLVIDAKNLPSTAVIQLDNVDFAAVVGAATLRGGDGRNIVVGDDAAQNILLGADDDILAGGAGNDTVGSAGGNDQLDGGSGDDIVVGGIGNDSLQGGAGNDAVEGGRSDKGAWQFTVDASGKLAVTHGMAVFAPGTNEAVAVSELDHGNAALSFVGASSAKLADIGLLYQAIFGRAPDLGGINYWAGKAVGASETAAFMLKSAEWAGNGGAALSDEGFVRALYQHALGREVDDQGLAFWLGKLDAGTGKAMSRADVAAAVALSDEHRASHTVITVGEGTLANENGWFANSGDDRLDGGAGSDLMVGGDGVDTIVYGGARTDYKLVLGNAGQVLVEDKANGDLDTISGIEKGAFADGTVDVSFTQAAPELLQELGMLYHAVLGRTADFGGFAWWMQQGRDAKGLVEGVMGAQEYKADYANTTDAQFVQGLFKAAGLDANAAGGVQGWQDYLASHTRAELIGKWISDDTVIQAQVDANGLWLV